MFRRGCRAREKKIEGRKLMNVTTKNVVVTAITIATLNTTTATKKWSITRWLQLDDDKFSEILVDDLIKNNRGGYYNLDN